MRNKKVKQQTNKKKHYEEIQFKRKAEENKEKKNE